MLSQRGENVSQNDRNRLIVVVLIVVVVVLLVDRGAISAGLGTINTIAQIIFFVMGSLWLVKHY
jgi:hypothetical protein